MEKGARVVLMFVFLVLVLSLAFVSAQNETTETEKINKAYQCLNDKVQGNCEQLSSLQEKTFSLLALDECQAELVRVSSNDGECWSSGNCKVKDTAQAVLALDNTNAEVSSAEAWLLSQKSSPTDINWYLEIDTNEASTCTISYSGSSYTVDINEDKTFSNDAGRCLFLTQDDYWLQISSSCLDETFEVSCDKDFLTTLLFQESGESTVHVTDKASSAAAGGTISEKVESFCFGTNSCDYEGSLWSALVLDSLGNDVSAFLPYLIVKADENERFLPEAFLYLLTGNEDYRSSLLSKQKSNKWWAESGDRYYDTAMALYPFQNENPQEKQNAKDWLLSVQDEEGCWEGNIRNTGFLLASIWPQDFKSGTGGGTGGVLDCKAAGYYCMSGASCTGEILDEYSCPSLFRCCSQPQEFETCSELGGEICSSNQICRGGDETNTADLTRGQVCCVGGSCETETVTQQPENECEEKGGICKFTCKTGESQTSYDCEASGAVCCIFEGASGGTGEKGGYWWIWTLLILIVLAVVGIIFRDKLREWWLKLKSGFGKGKGSGSSSGSGRPRGPPRHGFPSFPSRKHPIRPPERRILLPKEPDKPRSPPKPLKKSGSQKELDDVLKKLKEMGK